MLMSELFSMRAKSAAIAACTALLFAVGTRVNHSPHFKPSLF